MLVEEPSRGLEDCIALAQPRNVIGGHFLSALVGMLVLHFMGTGTFEMALGVGTAIALMQLFRAVHPPAGANPLVIILAGTVDYTFLLTPVLAGSFILILTALFINNVGTGRKWPVYWV
ncbi:HPP family protein [Litchfieldella qijiaojingensis]